MKTERFEALIDAILAIILTVIVLEIPMASNGSWGALFELRLDFIVYALSFLVVFNYWNYNNNIFSIVNTIDHKIIWSIGLSIFVLSLLPYLTIFVANNFYSFTAHACYGIDFLITAILSLITAKALKNSDKGNIALQVALKNNYSLYSTIIIMIIGFIVGYFIYPPAVTIACLISMPVLWIVAKLKFM